MSRNNTGNPIDSKAFPDFEDNVKNLDLAVNSDELRWSDRFGRDRKSFEGMEREFDSAQYSREARFNDFISASGYQFLGDYADGLEFTEYNQLVRDENGEFWRLSGQIELPYTTTGSGIPEDDALVPAGDAVLRQDLANPNIGRGTDMMAFTGTTKTVTEALMSPNDFVDIKLYGAKGDGVTDDTAAINACLASESQVYFSAGTYMIDASGINGPYDGGLHFQSNQTVIAHPNCLLKVIPNNLGSYVCCNMSGTENTKIIGLKVRGDLEEHTDTGGEWGMGFLIRGATNPVLIDCGATHCWGDGCIVDGGYGFNAWTKGGRLDNFRAYYNRRQGLSIVNWDAGTVIGGEFGYTGRMLAKPPSAGIDIEPNPNQASRINVSLAGVSTTGNYGSGILMVPGFQTTAPNDDAVYVVDISGHKSVSDVWNLTGGNTAIRITYPGLAEPGVDQSKQLVGQITYNSSTINDSGAAGLHIGRYPKTAVPVYVDGVSVNNPNGRYTSGVQKYQCGVSVSADAGQESTPKIKMTNVECNDYRDTPKMLRAFWLEGESASNRVKNVYLENISSNFEMASFLWQKDTENCRVVPAQKMQAITATTTSIRGEYSGRTIYAEGATRVFYLESCNNNIGQSISFLRVGNNISVRPREGERIFIPGQKDGPDEAGRQIILSNEGDFIELTAFAEGWVVTKNSSTSIRTGRTGVIPDGTGLPLYHSAPPGSGSWYVGNIFYNVAPEVGRPVGWVCTSTGSPGVWRPFGIIEE